jgi:hypothetical protein
VRLNKMLGLAAVAATAAMAFIGASTASAGIHEAIGFCLKNEPLLCASANLVTQPVGGGVIFLAESKKAELKNNGLFSTPEVCHSTVGVLTNELMNNPIVGNVTSLIFDECTGPCKKAKSSASESTPFKGTLSMATVGGSEWTLKAEEGSALLSECTFGVECEYGVPATGATLVGTNSAEGGVVKANGVALTLKKGSEFTCGSSGTWTAEYKATDTDLENSKKEITKKDGKWWFTLLGEVDKTH